MKVESTLNFTPPERDSIVEFEPLEDSDFLKRGSPATDRGLPRGSVTEPYGEEMPPPQAVGRRPASDALEAATEHALR